jgi:hypothetical protein
MHPSDAYVILMVVQVGSIFVLASGTPNFSLLHHACILSLFEYLLLIDHFKDSLRGRGNTNQLTDFKFLAGHRCTKATVGPRGRNHHAIM